MRIDDDDDDDDDPDDDDDDGDGDGDEWGSMMIHEYEWWSMRNNDA